MSDNSEYRREALDRASRERPSGWGHGSRPLEIFWTEPRASFPAGRREEPNLHDLDTQYDDPLQVRALLIELNAWDVVNDCFVPERLFETEETATLSHHQPTGPQPDASERT